MICVILYYYLYAQTFLAELKACDLDSRTTIRYRSVVLNSKSICQLRKLSATAIFAIMTQDA